MTMSRATAALLVLLCVGVAVAATTGSIRTSFPPAPQSDYQRSYMRHVSELSANASRAATPRLLAALATPAFERQLATCCPALVGLPATRLLGLIEAEVAVAEITHNFAAPDSSTGPNISGMVALRAVPNTWMSALRGDMNPPNASASAGLWACEGGVELGLFGMKPFSLPSPAWMTPLYNGIGWPASVQEAADRPVYGIWNLWKQAMPGRMYGRAAVVFRNSVVQAGTFTAPMDSGAWIQECNATRNFLSYPCITNGGGADACLCDGSVSHNMSRCEAATEHSDVKGLNARNPLCQWVDGSTETVWACPGGVNSTDDHCINGSVITRPLPAGQPPTKNGTCRSEPYIVLTPLICTYLSRRITRLAMILPRVW